MGIFGKDSKKKQKNPNERNLIGDRQVTANLANTALGMLAQGEDTAALAHAACQLAQAAADALLARDPELSGCPETARRLEEMFESSADAMN